MSGPGEKKPRMNDIFGGCGVWSGLGSVRKESMEGLELRLGVLRAPDSRD